MLKRLGWRGLLVGLVIRLAAGGTFAWASIPNSANRHDHRVLSDERYEQGRSSRDRLPGWPRSATGQAMLTWPSRGFRWRGPWGSYVSYGVNDVVRYNGSAYIAKLREHERHSDEPDLLGVDGLARCHRRYRADRFVVM